MDFIEDKPRALTKKRLDAIIEALTSRLAGAIEGDREPYEAALIWARQQIAKRTS